MIEQDGTTIEVGSLYRRIRGNAVLITSDGKVHDIKLGDIVTFLELIREAKDSKTWKILTLDGILGTYVLINARVISRWEKLC